MYVIIDNYDSFTYNIYQYLSELTSIPVQVYRNDRISVEKLQSMDLSGLIISPGPGRPAQAGISIEAIRHFAGKVPILGVCLGHQAIGEAFGGKIVQAREIVHGKPGIVQHDKAGLFRNLPSPTPFTRYHSLAIEEESLPDALEVTARTPDGEIMGVRHKDYAVEGVQFHPESMASEQGMRLLKNFLNYRREPLKITDLIKKITAGNDLTESEARLFMEELTEGELSPAQIAAILIGINAKGPAASEIAGCASVLRAKCTPIELPGKTLDTCGTGGDGCGSFNISSFSALIAAACGAPVAKHGNRAVSSISGSADFYQKLGVPIDISPVEAESLFKETGFAFLYAPLYHQAMRHAGPVRRELGVKTLMNLVGPLSNPASAAYQIIGIYDPKLAEQVARAARMLGTQRVMVVSSDDGMDEISAAAPSTLVYIDENDQMTVERFDPASVGLPPFHLDDMAGGDASENVEIAEAILSGNGNAAVKAACLLNAGAALRVCGLADSVEEGYRKAAEALDSGQVKTQLEAIRKIGNALKMAGKVTA